MTSLRKYGITQPTQTPFCMMNYFLWFPPTQFQLWEQVKICRQESDRWLKHSEEISRRNLRVSGVIWFGFQPNILRMRICNRQLWLRRAWFPKICGNKLTVNCYISPFIFPHIHVVKVFITLMLPLLPVIHVLKISYSFYLHMYLSYHHNKILLCSLLNE